MAEGLKLPIIDLSSPDRISAANSIRQACIECGFFYLVNHGVEEELLKRTLDKSEKFFSFPLEEKMKLARKEHRGYTPLYAENLNPSSSSQGDSKESFYIGPLDGVVAKTNQWPSEGIILPIPHLQKTPSLSLWSCFILEIPIWCIPRCIPRHKTENLPCWKSTMESYYEKVLAAGKKLLLLIALALNLDEDFFEKIGALGTPMAFLRLLHYPGELRHSAEEICGASAHSDYGMITLLACNGIPGLQVCRDKFKQPQKWEDVPHINGALIVNIGDMMDRWTNGLFRSTLHRVKLIGQERYSMAFFLDPNHDCVVECLKSCCSESSPPRFPPIRSGDYLEERFRRTYSS